MEATNSEATAAPAAPSGALGAPAEPSGGQAINPEAAGTPAAPLPWYERAVPGRWKNEDEAIKGVTASTTEGKRLAAELAAAQERIKPWEAMHGAPKDAEGKPAPYEFALPEGTDLDADFKTEFEAFCHERDWSKSEAETALKRFLPWFLGEEVGKRETSAETMAAIFGAEPEKQEAGRAQLEQWAGRLGLGRDEQAVADWIECGRNPAALRTIARLHAGGSGGTIGRSDGSGSGTYDLSSDSSRQAIMASERFKTDRMYREGYYAALGQAHPKQAGE